MRYGQLPFGRWTSGAIAVLLLWNGFLTVALVRREATATPGPSEMTSAVTLGYRWAIEPSTLRFDGVSDDVLFWGYNIAPGGDRTDSRYPQFRQSFEQRYEDSEGLAFTEWNLDFLSADGRTRRRPLAVAVELPTIHVAPDNVHVVTRHSVSLSLAADNEEFLNADRTRTRLAISDDGIGVGANPGSGADETKVMVYRRSDTDAVFELRTGVSGEDVWQLRYGSGVGAPTGSVAFYNATNRLTGPVVLDDGTVQTGATDRFRYREPLQRISQRAAQAVPPYEETLVRFAGSTQSLSAPVAGNYALIGGVASAEEHPMIAWVRVNGVKVAAGKGTVFGIYRLAAGDIVTLSTAQTSTAVEHTSGDEQTFLSLVYEGE